MDNLEYLYENDDTVYHVILRNEKLTEQEVIAISELFLNHGVNPNARNQKNKAALHLVIENRMRNVTEFFMKCDEPNDLLKPHNDLIKFFIEDENAKFWKQVKQKSDNLELWSSENTESESASFLEWLISKKTNCDHGNNQRKSALDSALEYKLQHLLPVLLRHTNNLNLSNSVSPQLTFSTLPQKDELNSQTHNSKPKSHWYSSYTQRYASQIVKVLLERGMIVNEHWREYVTLAVLEEKYGYMNIVKLLINDFEDDSPVSSYATSFLSQLMKYPWSRLSGLEVDRYLLTLRYLETRGADVNQKNESGLSPVQMAVKTQHLRAVIWLADVGADFSVFTENNENLLHLLFCMSRPADVQEEILDLLVAKGCQVNVKDIYSRSPLHLAVTNRNVKLAQKLIEHGAEVDCQDDAMQTPLHRAVTKNIETTELCKQEKEDVQEAILDLLVGECCQMNARDMHGRSPLHLVATNRNVRLAQKLIAHGADVDCQDNEMQTPLHRAVVGIDVEEAMLDLLIGRSCRVNARDAKRRTPLHLAAEHENAVAVKKLIEHNAEVNCRDDSRKTPLHCAVRRNKMTEVVQILLECGANVNARDVEGKDPLYFAFVFKLQMFEMVKVLLKWGAQVNSLHETINDQTDLKLAIPLVSRAVVKEFLSNGLTIVFSRFYRCLIQRDCDVADFVKQHRIKLKAAQLLCSKRCEVELGDEKSRKYYQECLREVETLKATFIDSRTSLYRLLHTSLDKRCIHINNEKLKNLIDSPALEEQFPKYADVILANYREMAVRQPLLEPAKAAWLELTGIALPDICIERILSYLSHMNLVDMIYAD